MLRKMIDRTTQGDIPTFRTGDYDQIPEGVT